MKNHLMAGLIALSFVGAGTAHAQQNTLHYEPAVVQLTGTVKLERHYGPPGFGSSPRTDRVEMVPVLVLSAPVNVVGNPPDSKSRVVIDGTSYQNVSRMQMVFGTPGQSTRGLDGEPVTVTGTLFEKVSGENYTNVLVDVRSLALGNPRSR